MLDKLLMIACWYCCGTGIEIVQMHQLGKREPIDIEYICFNCYGAGRELC